jgi:EpsD family peptidyl-prolyl cis-trans isomerase
MKKMHRTSLSVLAMAVAVALTLAGCGDKNESVEKIATQVAAKVNGDEITVHQLNFELSKIGNLSPDQTKEAANNVLKSMVDQQLLVQKAIEDKLDRDPEVVQSLEASRRQILAQAVIKQLTANQAAPSDTELADYYAQNPALFAERRVYRLQEINVQVTPENVESVKTRLQNTKNLTDFINWLKAQNIPARANQSTKTAEQLPLELLPRVHALKNGQAVTFAAPGILNILIVADSQTQPLTQEQAKPMIERYLANAKKREIAEAELKLLKDKAKLVYVGEYAEVDYKVDSENHSETANQTATAVGTDAASKAISASDAAAIDKGLNSLK